MISPVSPGKKHYLVVVADESRAILYARAGRRGPLKKLRSFTNEAARMKTGDLLADRGGRSFDSHGQGRHTMQGEKVDPKQHLATAFAKKIAEHIATDVHKGSCEGFALVAAPRFLGTLRQETATLVRTEPYATVNKDVVGKDEAVIEKLLAPA